MWTLLAMDAVDVVYINHKVHPSNDSIWLQFLVLFLLFASNAPQMLSSADGGGGGGGGSVVELHRC